jgi:glycosyltransferase involved in cell wall biosynthesis
MLTKQDVLVIIPAFNEQESIGQVIADISHCGYKYVVIDDGSEDETRKRVLEAGGDVLTLPINGGVGAALRCGFKYAIENGYKAVIQCDADGQHPVGYLDNLIDAMNEMNADLVIGSRFESDLTSMSLSALRRTAMYLLARIASRYVKQPISDATSGFRIIKSPLLESFAKSFPTYYLGDTFEALVVAGKANYKIGQTPTPLVDRQTGKPSSSNSDSVRQIAKVLLVAILGLHTNIPNSSKHA